MSVEVVSEGEETFSLVDLVNENDSFSEMVSSFAHGVLAVNRYPGRWITNAFLPIHPGKHGHHDSWMKEFSHRAVCFLFGIPSWMGTLAGAAVASTALKVSNLLRNYPCRITLGRFQGEPSPMPKLLFFNPCLLKGIGPLKKSGLTPSSDRLEGVVALLALHDPDLLVLSDVDRSIAPSLIDNLKKSYNFFFTEIGQESSFFIALRGDLVAPPEFLSFGVQGRGCFIIETEGRVYLFSEGLNESDLQQILERDFGEKNVFFIGDVEEGIKSGFLGAGWVSLMPEEETINTSSYVNFYGGDEDFPSSRPVILLRQQEGTVNVLPLGEGENLSDHSLILHR